MEAEIIKHDPSMQELDKRQGRLIIPHDASVTHRSGEYRMLPPKPSSSPKAQLLLSALANSSPKLKEFTLFAELPLELRLKIWQHTFPGPRVVKVNSYGIVKQDGYNFHAFYSTSPIPMAMSICSESRIEALRHYHASFGMRYPSIPSIIYFNYEIDTLYFEFDSHQALNSQLLILALSDRYLQFDGRVGMKFVQSVAVSHRIGIRKWETLFGYLTKFEGLRQFVIGAERESPPVPDNAVLEEPEENDESLSGIRKVLYAARDGWKEMWDEELPDGVGVPELKIMEVRS